QGVFPLLQPVAPFNRPGFVAPAVAIGGLIGVLLLSGLAVTALGSLLLALLALYLLLVQVFGLSIELHPFGFGGGGVRARPSAASRAVGPVGLCPTGEGTESPREVSRPTSPSARPRRPAPAAAARCGRRSR